MATYIAASSMVAAASNITVPWPAGYTIGDLGLLIIEAQNGDTPSLATSGGFTLLGQATYASAPTTRLQIYYCFATSLTMTSPITTGVSDHASGTIIVYRGVSNPTFYSDWQKSEAGTSTIPAVTTSKPNQTVVCVVAWGADASGAQCSGWTNANLSNLTERYDSGTTLGNGGGLGIADGVKVAAGSTGTTTLTISAAYYSTIAIALTNSVGMLQTIWFD